MWAPHNDVDLVFLSDKWISGDIVRMMNSKSDFDAVPCYLKCFDSIYPRLLDPWMIEEMRCQANHAGVRYMGSLPLHSDT